MKFDATQAIEICLRKLHYNHNHDISICHRCYYHDGKCELNKEPYHDDCVMYRNDVLFTNHVRKQIIHNPEWCRDNWEVLCYVDRALYCAIYGGIE